MSDLQIIYLTLILALSVWLTRFLPFMVFKNAEHLPKIIEYLGKVLPAAMTGLLVVYCLKDYSYTDIGAVLPLIIAVASVVVLHLIKHNTILSISVGTVLYMVLIRVI